MKKVHSHDKRSKVLIKTSWFDDFMADLPQKRDAPRVAPPLLELTENDKFVDDEGNVFEVEIRGTSATKMRSGSKVGSNW